MAIEVYSKLQVIAIMKHVRSVITTQFAKLGTAAKRDIGVFDGQVPLAEDAYKAAFSRRNDYYNSGSANDPATIKNANDFDIGTRHLVFYTHLNMPATPDFYFVETLYNFNSNTKLQKAWGYNNTSMFVRSLNAQGVWSQWRETVFNGTAPEFTAIKVGVGAPRVATAKASGVTPASSTSNTVTLNIAHGLTASKILSCQGFIDNGTKRTPIPTQATGINYR